MPALTLLVASIALADSINPSTVVPAIWMARSPGAHLVSFALGAFIVYTAGGLVLVFGPGPALMGALHDIGGTVEHVVEAVAGTLVLCLAFLLWQSRHNERDTRLPQPGDTRLSAFGLGAGIMVVELPTAFVYFGAISAILAAHRAAPLNAALLVAYNLIFVAPVIAIAVVHRLPGDHAQRWLASAWERVLGFGQILLASLTGGAGAVLLVVGVTGLLTA